MTERITSFPNNPPFGTTHYEHGRSWEYVYPGMWKSTAGAGATMDVYWDDILGKPSEFPPEDHQHLYPDIINDDSGVSLDADLDSIRDKVSQIDQELDSIAGNLAFSGTVMISTGVIDSLTDHGTEVGFVIGPIPTNPPEGSENSYFICEDDGVFAGMSLTGGDWIISEGRNKGWTSVSFTTSVNVLWDDVGNKPDVYPPEDHLHQIDDVFGLQDALDNAGADAYDDTQIKADLLAETEAREREDLILQNQIDDIDSFPEAPVDGVLYGRQDKGWVQVPDPTEPYDDTEIRSDLADEITARTEADAAINERIDNLDLTGGGGDDYQYWRVQAGVSDNNPYNVESKGVLTFEGANGIEITRSGSYVTFSYAGNDLGDSFDNYQWWRFAIDGSNTTNVLSQQTIDFRAGDNISLVKGTAGGNYTITISAEVPDAPTTDLTGYATQTWVSSNYQPKGSYLTSSSLNGYATQTWVSQNYQPKGNYLTSFTESDPVFKASPAGSITQAMINNWNSAGSGSTPTLQAVTDAGAATTKNITANTYFTQSDTWTCGKSGGARIFCSNGTIALKNSGGHNTLQVSATGDVTATQDVTAFSDVRLKENIETLDGSKVYDMRGVSFTKDGREGSGVIAQELQQIAPELVRDDGEYLSVAYGNLVGYLIEAVKELKAEVEELKRD